MSLDIKSLRTQLESDIKDIARLQASEPVGPVEHCQTCGGYLGEVNSRYGKYNDACGCQTCHRCGETILKDDYRVQDDLGNSYDIQCYEKLISKMETDR